MNYAFNDLIKLMIYFFLFWYVDSHICDFCGLNELCEKVSSNTILFEKMICHKIHICNLCGQWPSWTVWVCLLNLYRKVNNLRPDSHLWSLWLSCTALTCFCKDIFCVKNWVLNVKIQIKRSMAWPHDW